MVLLFEGGSERRVGSIGKLNAVTYSWTAEDAAACEKQGAQGREISVYDVDARAGNPFLELLLLFLGRALDNGINDFRFALQLLVIVALEICVVSLRDQFYLILVIEVFLLHSLDIVIVCLRVVSPVVVFEDVVLLLVKNYSGRSITCRVNLVRGRPRPRHRGEFNELTCIFFLVGGDELAARAT